MIIDLENDPKERGIRLMCIGQEKWWPNIMWDRHALRPCRDRIRGMLGKLLGRTETVPAAAELDVEMDALI